MVLLQLLSSCCTTMNKSIKDKKQQKPALLHYIDRLMSRRAVNDNKSVSVGPPEATSFPAGSSVVRIIRSLEKNLQSRAKLVVSPGRTCGLSLLLKLLNRVAN